MYPIGHIKIDISSQIDYTIIMYNWRKSMKEIRKTLLIFFKTDFSNKIGERDSVLENKIFGERGRFILAVFGTIVLLITTFYFTHDFKLFFQVVLFMIWIPSFFYIPYRYHMYKYVLKQFVRHDFVLVEYDDDNIYLSNGMDNQVYKVAMNNHINRHYMYNEPFAIYTYQKNPFYSWRNYTYINNIIYTCRLSEEK